MTDAFEFGFFVNPLQLLEVDEPWASDSKKSLSSDDIFKFLCTPSIPSDVESLAKRYKEISIETKRLFVAPDDQRVPDKLVWPLRHAKASYVLGNFLGTISLCGLVAEMIALFLFELSILENANIKSKDGELISSNKFESEGQQKRIQLLYRNNLVDEGMKSDFDLIRTIRRKYLHLWSQDHGSLQQDALAVFPATVSLVVRALGLKVSQGNIILKQSIVEYLKRTGSFRPEDDTEDSSPSSKKTLSFLGVLSVLGGKMVFFVQFVSVVMKRFFKRRP